MKPLAVLNGIFLGSSFSIFIGLVVVVFLYLVNIQADYIRDEIPELLRHSAIFFVFTLVTAVGFYGVLMERWWQWYGQLLVFASLVALVVHYWPEQTT